MVCPKLNVGYCRALKSPCPQKYGIKMIKHAKCSVFKGKKLKTSKLSKASKKVSKRVSKKAKSKTTRRKSRR